MGNFFKILSFCIEVGDYERDKYKVDDYLNTLKKKSSFEERLL